MKNRIQIQITVVLVAGILVHAASAGALDLNPSEITVHGGTNLGNGEPANDIIGYGLKLHWGLDDGWYFGLGLDRHDFDFEYPYKILRVEHTASSDIDSKASATQISAWLERRFRENADVSFFGALGLGVSLMDAGDIEGPNTRGGYHIQTDAGTEYLFSLAVGPRYRISRNWGLTGRLGIDYHVADWKVADRVSGKTGTVDDYTTMAFYMGLTYFF